jgi:hypothetical protein
MIFKLQGNLVLDSNKRNIVIYDKNDFSSRTIYGAARVMLQELEKNYNIIVIGSGCKLSDNYYSIQRELTDELYRKADNKNHIEENDLKIWSWFEESFKDLSEIDYILLGTDDFFRLPQTSYVSKKESEILYNRKNEYFDFIGEDEKIIELINNTNKSIISNWSKVVSPYAFSTRDYSIFMSSINFFHKTGRLKKHVIAFIIDPVLFSPYFKELNIPTKLFYFENDKRGTRDFQKLDIAQLQHLIYDKQFKDDSLDDWGTEEKQTKQTENLFFAGTIFIDKGNRSDIWESHLKNIQSEKCKFYIPLKKNGMYHIKNPPLEHYKKQLQDSKFKDLYKDIINHKNFQMAVPSKDLNKTISIYKYGIIFRCISINDSLNFRPVLYTYLNILPLLDPLYDPNFLQIPKKIQNEIIVNNAKEIDEKILFFNENPDKRISIINDLYKLFKLDDYISDHQKMLKLQTKLIL